MIENYLPMPKNTVEYVIYVGFLAYGVIEFVKVKYRGDIKTDLQSTLKNIVSKMDKVVEQIEKINLRLTTTEVLSKKGEAEHNEIFKRLRELEVRFEKCKATCKGD